MEYITLNFLSEDMVCAADLNGGAGILGEYIAGIDCEGGAVCFSGSRPASLPWKNNEECELCVQFKKVLREILVRLIEKGCKRFISGMALGVDTIAAEIVLELREKYDITLEAAIPFERQSARWSPEQRERYDRLLKEADLVTYVGREYSPYCYARRNEYMCKNASILIAYPCSSDGGTASTINIAKKLKKNIIILK